MDEIAERLQFLIERWNKLADEEQKFTGGAGQQASAYYTCCDDVELVIDEIRNRATDSPPRTAREGEES